MPLRPVALKPKEGFHFILFSHFEIASGQNVPNAFRACADAGGALTLLAISPFALHLIELFPLCLMRLFHRELLFIEWPDRVMRYALRFRDITREARADRLTNVADGIGDRAKDVGIAEARSNFLRFSIDHAGDGEGLALYRNGDMSAPITLR